MVAVVVSRSLSYPPPPQFLYRSKKDEKREVAACLFDAANDTLVPVISRQAAAVGAAGREVEVQRLLQGSEEEKPGLAQCLAGAPGQEGCGVGTGQFGKVWRCC